MEAMPTRGWVLLVVSGVVCVASDRLRGDEASYPPVVARHLAQVARLVERGRAGRAASQHALPRRIFCYWDTGQAGAPEVAQYAVATWAAMNPDYELHYLNASSALAWFPDYDTLWAHTRVRLVAANRAAYLRTYLLAAYGGVWADVTTLCHRPLDTWLRALIRKHGAYVFSHPTLDRQVTNWFMAGSALTSELLADWLDVYARHLFAPRRLGAAAPIVLDPRTKSSNGSVVRADFLAGGRCADARQGSTGSTELAADALVGPNATGLDAILAYERRGVYPYFIHHYMFNQALRERPELAARWSRIQAEPLPSERRQLVAKYSRRSTRWAKAWRGWCRAHAQRARGLPALPMASWNGTAQSRRTERVRMLSATGVLHGVGVQQLQRLCRARVPLK